MNLNSNFLRQLLVVVLILGTYNLVAGPPPAPSDGGAPNAIPIDGGLLYLTAIGAVVGIRKLIQSKK